MNAFATHGGEKMVYDWRMRPQAVRSGPYLHVAYQAALPGAAVGDKSGIPAQHPHVARLDLRTGEWSEPGRPGCTEGVNHHFAPVLWLDNEQRLHVLYHCHRSAGRHKVSVQPHDPAAWTDGPEIAPSMTYPALWRSPAGELVLLYREGGHLGDWVWKTSNDGGWSWSAAQVIIDFDANPQTEGDRWAGVFPCGCAAPDGLHLAFVRWEERDNRNPCYNTFQRDMFSRYDAHYVRLAWDGSLTDVDGRRLARPLCRREAATTLVFDSGHELTNSPSLAVDDALQPLLVLPVSEGSPWRCRLTAFFRNKGVWRSSGICLTDNTWSGSLLQHDGERCFTLWLISGQGKDESCFYGGGELQAWRTRDGGATWHRALRLDPRPGFLYNNPQPVVDEKGQILPNHVLFYGWQGPQSLWNSAASDHCGGQAFLYMNDTFKGKRGPGHA